LFYGGLIVLDVPVLVGDVLEDVSFDRLGKEGDLIGKYKGFVLLLKRVPGKGCVVSIRVKRVLDKFAEVELLE
jgi:predicted RNA-binding protein with TRAM domain